MTEKKIAVQQMLLVSGLLGCSVDDNQKSRHVHGQRLIVKLSNILTGWLRGWLQKGLQNALMHR